MPTLKLLHVKGTPIYDVFIGEGWYNWTRILVRENITKTLQGNTLTKELLLEIKTQLKATKNAPIN